MFRFIAKKMGYLYAKSQIPNPENRPDQSDSQSGLSENLYDNIKTIQTAMGNSSDVVMREFSFGQRQIINAVLVFIDGLSDVNIINENIIEPLMHKTVVSDFKTDLGSYLLKHIKTAVLSASEVRTVDQLNDAVDGFLSGDAVLLINGSDQALVIGCQGWEKRNIIPPSGESVLRGPRESFTEDLNTNTSLIRRKIKNPLLTMESVVLGEKTKTKVCFFYIRGVADHMLIRAVRERMSAINTDAILESGYIEQFIEDSPSSIFATIGNSEKPDVVAAKLLEGRIAILVDGTPFVLTAPYLFIESFQAAEDYYFRPYYMSLLRIVRYISYFLSVLAPSIYVAATTFQPELIPTNLLFTMAKSREGLPFPAFVESVIMLLTFEILREAGVRLPRPIGQAMSIVGALVIGESSVSAGLIGAPMVIVVAITAVSIFVVPNQSDSAALLRIILLILSGLVGFYGIAIGMLGALVHMASLESFGVPFLSPLAPFNLKGMKDMILRAPLWVMLSRPEGMAPNNRKRTDYFIPPAGKSNENK